MVELTWGIAGGLGTGLAWAAISILVQSLSGVLRPVSITAIRSAVGGVIIVVVALAAGYGSEIVRMPLWAVLALWASILLSMGFGDTVFFASMDHLGVTRALILSLANPLFTTIVGIGLLGERVTLPRVFGILLIVGGLALIISGKGESDGRGRGDTRRGLKLVFLAAGAWALAAVIMQPPLQTISATAAAAVRIPMAGLVIWLTPWTRGTVRELAKISQAERWRLIAICILSAAGSLLFTTGIKYGGVAVGNVLASTSPLFTLPFEVLVLHQRPSARTVFGAVVTVGGVGLLNV
ncbi:MAG TPA: DMT family transporter [Candidatus Methylomirabilis sp.]|nr:DMT family transporter [Candidatus Methylomirabilis sp.]